MPNEFYYSSLYTGANCISYYRLEGNGNDAKGSNTLTNAGGSFSTGDGKFNQGCGFTGSTTSWLYNAAFSGMPTGLNPKSICCWFSPKSQPGANVTYGISGYWGEEASRTFDLAYVDVSGTKKLYFRPRNANDIYYPTTCNTGTKYHIGMTYDGTYLYAYLNGSQVGKVATSLDTQANGKLVLGGFAQSDIYGSWGNVSVDEFVVANICFSPEQMNAIANGSNGLIGSL